MSQNINFVKVLKTSAIFASAALLVGGFFVADVRAIATNPTDQATLQAAIDTASDGDTITLGADITTNSQINVTKAITIDGAGHRLNAIFAKTSNSNNAAIGITHPDATIKNLVEDGTGSTNLHGINIYTSTGVTLDTVTVSNNGRAGIIVNGSTVTATNLNTNNNVWGAVNVDPGVGVASASFFTLNSGTLAESTQIWSDGSNVSGSATVTVNATGYNVYAVGGHVTPFFVWTNRALTNAATITSGSTTTLYPTIQAAITAANPGDTINVAAGTYTEQLTVSKNLTLVGQGAGSTVIKAPATLNPDSSGAKNVVTISGSGINVELSGFTVSGPGPAGCGSITAGIFVRDGATANIHDNTVSDVRDNPFSGCQNGAGIFVGRNSYSTTGIATITNNTITGYQKGGIVIDNAGSSATISGNTVTGVGPTALIAQNGIQVSRGATASVTNNQISGNVYTGGAGACAGDGSSASDKTTFYANCDSSAGLLLYNHGAGVTATGNTITTSQLGVDVSGAQGATVRNNSILSSALYALYADVVSVDATENWWGVTTSSAIQALVAGSVNFDPWYLNSGKTILSSSVSGDTITTNNNLDLQETSDGEVVLPGGASGVTLDDTHVLDTSSGVNTVSGGQVTVGGAATSLSSFPIDSGSTDLSSAQSVGGESVTVGKAVKLSSGSVGSPITLSNSGLSNVEAAIPDGAVVLAPSGWDGKIEPPKSGSGSGSVSSSAFAIGDQIIEVGSPNNILLFNKPVTLTVNFTGSIGYKPAGSSVWTPINTTCGGTYNNPTAPAFPGECIIVSGNYTKIVTYHFTTFGNLININGSSSVGWSGGFYGGGGAASSASAATTAPTTTSTTTATTTVTTPAPTSTPAPAGQVLGVSTYNFGANLGVGSRGDAVGELQKRLASEGVYSGPVTGYFGKLTLAAVKAYQVKNSLPQTGVVGVLTREALNGSKVAGMSTTSDEVILAKIAALKAQIDALQKQLQELNKQSGQ